MATVGLRYLYLAGNNFPIIASQFAMHFCMTAVQNIFCVAVFFHRSVNIYPSAEIANQIWGGKLFPAWWSFEEFVIVSYFHVGFSLSVLIQGMPFPKRSPSSTSTSMRWGKLPWQYWMTPPRSKALLGLSHYKRYSSITYIMNNLPFF